MAQSIAQQAVAYPLAAYSFRVDVGGQTLAFTEVSGLVRELRTHTYRHGLSHVEGEDIVVYRHETFAPLQCKRGVVPGLNSLYEWLESAEQRTLTVSMCDHTATPVLQWRVQRAYLVKIEAPTFQAAASEAAIESLTLMACGIRVQPV